MLSPERDRVSGQREAAIGRGIPLYLGEAFGSWLEKRSAAGWRSVRQPAGEAFGSLLEKRSAAAGEAFGRKRVRSVPRWVGALPLCFEVSYPAPRSCSPPCQGRSARRSPCPPPGARTDNAGGTQGPSVPDLRVPPAPPRRVRGAASLSVSPRISLRHRPRHLRRRQTPLRRLLRRSRRLLRPRASPRAGSATARRGCSPSAQVRV